MPIHGSHCRRETDDADHHENYWPGLAERKTTAGLFKKKQNSHGDDYRRPHQATDGTTAAAATNAITHLCWPPTTFSAPIPVDTSLRLAISVPADCGTSTRQRQLELGARNALFCKTGTTQN